MPIYSIGEAARRLGCPPKTLTDWFYIGKLDTRKCPVFAGRRQIPASYLPAIADALRARGYKVSEEATD